jgi:hypothetical protein
VECGFEGAFGGWEEGDGGRIKLDPAQVYHPFEHAGEPPAHELARLSWFDVTIFLGCGQAYE